MHQRALKHLKRVDPVLARVIATVGACTLRPHADGTHFNYLVRAIVYQQLSGKAAATILGRVRDLLGGPMIDPLPFLDTPDEPLRTAGLSRQKIGYLRDLAQRAVSGALQVGALHQLPDEDVMTQLVQVKGIGKWTAQMFLMFRLGRPDILPDGDLGIQKGVKKAYGLRKLPSPARVEKIGAPWAPYRTVASWYMYRVLEVDFTPRPRARRA